MLTFTLPAFFRPGHYTGFYLLAVAAYQLLLLWEGRQRGYPLRPWLLMQATTLLAFIVGCKLIVLPWAEWPGLWDGAALPAIPVRSALGGVAASGAVLLALRRWLGLPWAAFDAFVLPLAVGLAVQCLGCLSAGCCWGAAAHGGLALCFGPGTSAYAAQVAAGLLPGGAAHTLPVVPTQLYALLACLGAAAVAWATLRRALSGGTRYLLGMGGLLLGWALLCEWREPGSQTLGAAPLGWGGVRLLAIQWSLLAVGALCLAAATAVRLWRPVLAPAPAPARPLRQLTGAALLLLLIVMLAPRALTGAEFRVVQAALGTVLLAEVVAVWPLLRLPKLEWRPGVGIAAALALLVLTSQTPAPQTRQDSVRTVDFAIGGVSGGFDQDEYYEATESGGCDGGGGSPIAATRDGYAHHYRAGGGQLAAQVRPDGRGGGVGTVGLGIWAGTDEVRYARQPLTGSLTFPASARKSTYGLLDINPFIEGWYAPFPKLKGFGFGYHGGLHYGNLVYSTAQRGDSVLARRYSIMPDLMTWIGNRQWLYAQADAGYGAASLGNYSYRLGLGSGLGSRRGGTVLAGVAFATLGSPTTPEPTTTSRASEVPATLGFMAANLRLGNSGFSLEPTAATNFAQQYQLSVRLHYRVQVR